MRKFKVGITQDFFVEAKGRFEAALQHKLAPLPYVEFESMPAQKIATPDVIDQYDAIFALAVKFNRESLQGIKRLALIARWGVGYDMIDTAALTDADAALAITPNAVRRPVAEAILTLIFALSKNLFIQDRLVREGKWRGDLPSLGGCLEGKTLGSVGCGNIAKEMFRLSGSLGFGRFIAYDPFATPTPGVELVSLEEVMRASDFVAVNTLLNADTHHMIREEQFRMMKPTAYFINTARGPIVDQAALTKALREHWIAGAGIDVFEQEPVAKDDPLLQLDNVILAPHGLAWTQEIARDNGLEACDNIIAISKGEVPLSVVNREVLTRPGFQAKLAAFRASH
ncbi:MAG: dehydrogenase [Acidobacteria bacterium]|nr:dehydrogenase [Acidobacteriota bacterium]